MKRIIAIRKLLFILFLLSILFKGYSQKKDLFEGWKIISVQKDTIFLTFNKEEKCDKRLKFYRKKEKGIIFNFCKKGSLLFPNKFKSDTLCYKHLKNYKISTMLDITKKVKDFRYKTYKKRPKSEHDKLFQAYDKNDMFQTYLIEIINKEKFVIYPVIWRNQRIIQ